MRTRTLGKTGASVTEIGLGCWQLGGDFGPVSEDTARAILSAADEAGISFWDTADVYGAGRSESLIGAHVAGKAERPFIATKVGRTDDLFPDAYSKATLADHLKQSADRLGLDALDLVQLHCIPPGVLEAGRVFDWMDELQAEGLTKAWGASVETIAEAKTCLAHPSCATLQVIFNLFRQDAATELLPQAHEQDVGVIVRLPLASGMLTGKYSRETVFAESDHRNYNRKGEAFSVGETFSGIPFETGLDLVEAIAALKPEGYTLADMAIRWILDHEGVTSVIAGCSRPEQVARNARVSDMAPLPRDLHLALAGLYAERVKPEIMVPV